MSFLLSVLAVAVKGIAGLSGPPPAANYLLQEDGFFLLQEDGFKIELP